MPKPIIFLGIPEGPDFSISNFIEKSIGGKFRDEYHFLIYKIKRDVPKMEVFYEKDFNEVRYEELKAIVKKALDDV